MKWIEIGQTFLGVAWALLAPQDARAAHVDLGGSILNDNTVVDHSGPGLLAFDVELADATYVVLKIDFDPDESSVAWNALVTDLYGLLIDRYPLSWFGAAMTFQGSVREGFDRDVPDVALSNADQNAEIDFGAPGEGAGFTVGNPGGLIAGATDWGVSAPSNGTSAMVVLPESEGPLLRWTGIAAVAGLAALRARRPSTDRAS